MHCRVSDRRVLSRTRISVHYNAFCRSSVKSNMSLPIYSKKGKTVSVNCSWPSLIGEWLRIPEDLTKTCSSSSLSKSRIVLRSSFCSDCAPESSFEWCMRCTRQYISSLKRFHSWTSETTSPMSYKTSFVFVKFMRSAACVVKSSFKSPVSLFVRYSRRIGMSSPVTCPVGFLKNSEIITMLKNAILKFATLSVCSSVVMMLSMSHRHLKNTGTVSMHSMSANKSGYISASSWHF